MRRGEPSRALWLAARLHTFACARGPPQAPSARGRRLAAIHAIAAEPSICAGSRPEASRASVKALKPMVYSRFHTLTSSHACDHIVTSRTGFGSHWSQPGVALTVARPSTNARTSHGHGTHLRTLRRDQASESDTANWATLVMRSSILEGMPPCSDGPWSLRNAVSCSPSTPNTRRTCEYGAWR